MAFSCFLQRILPPSQFFSHPLLLCTLFKCFWQGRTELPYSYSFTARMSRVSHILQYKNITGIAFFFVEYRFMFGKESWLGLLDQDQSPLALMDGHNKVLFLHVNGLEYRSTGRISPVQLFSFSFMGNWLEYIIYFIISILSSKSLGENCFTGSPGIGQSLHSTSMGSQVNATSFLRTPSTASSSWFHDCYGHTWTRSIIRFTLLGKTS